MDEGPLARGFNYHGRFEEMSAAARTATVLLGVLSLVCVSSREPVERRWASSSRDGRGVDVTVQEQTVDRSRSPRSPGPPLRYEYRYVAQCSGNTLDRPNEFDCESARTACGSGGDNTAGPLADVWRRTVGQRPGPRKYVTMTCFPPRTPGNRPAITVEMIRTAWRHTPFAKPALRIQPPGDAR